MCTHDRSSLCMCMYYIIYRRSQVSGSSAQYLSCKVFHDWSIINFGNILYLLNGYTPKVPKYYFCGDRFYQVLHTRLRTERSSLNQHLHKRNLVGNPYCICGEVESNTHYLLTCPHYTHMRDEMVTSISQITNLTITTDVLLFGNDEVSDEVNTTIFEAVQKIIKTSKRFAN